MDINNKNKSKKRNNLKKNIINAKKDKKGQMLSVDILFGLLILIIIIGVIASINNYTSEKVIDKNELANLEKLTIETSDYLIKNPGNPEDWEDNKELESGIVDKNIMAGLAIRNKNVKNGQFEDESESSNKVVANTISYEKLMKINSYYDKLIDKKIFNESIKSSIAIYPINSEIEPIICGNNLDIEDNNVINVERYVKCDFFKKFVIYDFNDLKLQGKDYTKEVYCNHDNVENLTSHSNTQRSIWLCKNLRIYKNSLENYSYYLITSKEIKDFNCYWTIEPLNKLSDKTEKLNEEVIDLNPFFENDLQLQSNNIYSIHFKIPKSNVNDFNSCIVAIPKNMTDNGIIDNSKLKYDYFQTQDVKFQMRTTYV